MFIHQMQQRGLARIDYRMAWEDAFRGYLKELGPKETCYFMRRFKCCASGN